MPLADSCSAKQNSAKQNKAEQNTHCPQMLCAKHLWTTSFVLCFALLCLANLEGHAKWAKAIFEGVPRLRHPGLGTLATSNPGFPGLGTLA